MIRIEHEFNTELQQYELLFLYDNEKAGIKTKYSAVGLPVDKIDIKTLQTIVNFFNSCLKLIDEKEV